VSAVVRAPALGLRRAVLAYQWVRQSRPSTCRYIPSCSTYALDALERHGAVRGAWYSLRRLSRCHPWGGSGLDPVPDRKCSRC
jgi:hypothetical protein